MKTEQAIRVALLCGPGCAAQAAVKAATEDQEVSRVLAEADYSDVEARASLYYLEPEPEIKEVDFRHPNRPTNDHPRSYRRRK
ncbi:hypothetical protein [Shimia sp.]|uniref:hypothetical protein n=1 Tax=Shimia sp. TaxID=1954381 RepID=UPI0032982589